MPQTGKKMELIAFFKKNIFFGVASVLLANPGEKVETCFLGVF